MPCRRYNKSSYRAQHLAAAQPVIQKRIGGGKKGGKASKLADDSDADKDDGDDGDGDGEEEGGGDEEDMDM